MDTTVDVRPQRAKPVSVGSSAVVGLAVAVFVLAAIAALAGLLSGGRGPETAVNVYGESVTLHGEGLYRHDTVFRAGANLGTDVLTLVLGLPFLAATTLMYRRGSAIGSVLLSGAFTYFLYLYSTMSLATAYNEMFLVYVALFGTSLFGLAFTIRSIDAGRIDALMGNAAPRRGLAILMVASGVVTAGVWLLPLVGALAAGEPPKLLDTSTTMVTDALDLAIITPTTLLAGVLLLRRRPEGWLITFPLLVLLIALLPMIVLQTVFQVRGGIEYTPPEIVGPIGGFVVLAGVGLWMLARTLRAFRVGGVDFERQAGSTST